MKPLAIALLLLTVGCGSDAPANDAASTTVDAVTAEAVSDTQAATADAQAAASAELDRIGTQEDAPPANDATGARDRVSNTTKVEVY